MYQNSWKNFEIDVSKNGLMCKFALRRTKSRFSVKKMAPTNLTIVDETETSC